MAAGFVHGVLNTDNINITGESFDYGPWRFLPTYDPDFTAAYFDSAGLYAFGRQPEALFWNLTRLAECLLPLAAAGASWRRRSTASAGVPATPSRQACCARLGLAPAATTADARAVDAAVRASSRASRAPFEQFFFDWHGGLASADRAAAQPRGRRSTRARPSPRCARPWRACEPAAGCAPRPPLLRRRRARARMLIDEVEALWAPIAASRRLVGLFRAKLAAIDAMAQAYGTRPAAA